MDISNKILELLEELALATSTSNLSTEDSSDPSEWDRRFTSGDADLLLTLGFKYGLSNETMWGRDTTGTEWCVTFDEYSGAGGATWFRLDSRGRKHRYGAMRYSTVHQLFDRKEVQKA